MHQPEQSFVEQRVERQVVDAERLALKHVDLTEPGSLEFLDEVTLRQGPGQSPGPGGWMRQNLRRELALVEGQIRYA